MNLGPGNKKCLWEKRELVTIPPFLFQAGVTWTAYTCLPGIPLRLSVLPVYTGIFWLRRNIQACWTLNDQVQSGCSQLLPCCPTIPMNNCLHQPRGPRYTHPTQPRRSRAEWRSGCRIRKHVPRDLVHLPADTHPHTPFFVCFLKRKTNCSFPLISRYLHTSETKQYFGLKSYLHPFIWNFSRLISHVEKCLHGGGKKSQYCIEKGVITTVQIIVVANSFYTLYLWNLWGWSGPCYHLFSHLLEHAFL